MLIRAGLVETHPIFKVYPGQVDAIREAFGFKDAKSLDDAVDVLETWVKQQNHFLVKDLGRTYLESYIIMAKGSIEKAKKRLDKRCTLRNMMPELFTNIRVDTEFNKLFNSYQHASMPMPTKDYYRITVDRYAGDVESFDHLQYARYLHVCAEYSMVNELIVGLESIIDLQEVALTDMMRKFNLVLLQKTMIMLIEGYGAKLKAIHIINSSKFVEKIVAMLKAGLSEKIKNRLHVHSTPETLHKFIAKESLPSDYGGTGPSISECHDMFFKELCTDHFKQRLKQVEHFQTDETRRVTSKFNDEYMGMPGSFRTLSVD